MNMATLFPTGRTAAKQNHPAHEVDTRAAPEAPAGFTSMVLYVARHHQAESPAPQEKPSRPTLLKRAKAALQRAFGKKAVEPASIDPRSKPATMHVVSKTTVVAMPPSPFTRKANVSVLMSFGMFSKDGSLFVACCFIVTTQPQAAPIQSSLPSTSPLGARPQRPAVVFKRAPQTQATQAVHTKAAATASSPTVSERIDVKPLVAKRPVERPVIEDVSEEERADEGIRPEEAPAAQRPVEERVAEVRIAEEKRLAEEKPVAEEEPLVQERPAEENSAELSEVGTGESRPSMEPAGETKPVLDVQPPVAQTPEESWNFDQQEFNLQNYVDQLHQAQTFDQAQADATERRRRAVKEHEEAQGHFNEAQRAVNEAKLLKHQAEQLRKGDPAKAQAEQVTKEAEQLEQQAQHFEHMAAVHNEQSLQRIAASQELLTQANFLDQQAAQVQQQIQAAAPAMAQV